MKKEIINAVMKRADCLGPMYSTPDGSLVVGSSVGSTVVSSVGSTEGSLVVGSSVGSTVVSSVGSTDGSLVVGSSVGSTVVSPVGSTEGSLVVGSSVVVVGVVSISHPTLRFVFGHLPSSLPQVISNVAKSTQSIFLSSSHVYSVYPYPSSEPSHNLAYLQSLLILSWPLHSQSPM